MHISENSKDYSTVKCAHTTTTTTTAVVAVAPLIKQTYQILFPAPFLQFVALLRRPDSVFGQVTASVFDKIHEVF